MKKPFLLIVHESYPACGIEDWRGCFESEEAAREYLDTFMAGVDWWIVDLREWTEK